MKNQDQRTLLHSIVRLRYNLMGLTATLNFKEGIAMTVAVGTTSLVWPLYVVMGDYYAVCIGKFSGTLHAA